MVRFEVFISTHYEDRKGDAKYKKSGGYMSLKVSVNSTIR